MKSDSGNVNLDEVNCGNCSNYSEMGNYYETKKQN